MTTTPPCPLCQGDSRPSAHPRPVRWHGKEFSYRRCRRCGTLFVDPLPGADELSEWYAHGSYHAGFYGSTSDDQYEPSVSWLTRFRPAPARLLDFGAGSGGFLRRAVAHGYSSQGVELSASTVEATRATGLDVISSEELDETRQAFDVIHLGDVLEHLPEPGVMLRRLQRHLAPGGVFFLEGPLEANASLVYAAAHGFSLAKSLRPRVEDSAEPPFHLTLASARGVRLFLERTMGYTLTAFETSETGWPYLNSGPASTSSRERLRRLIGQAAVDVQQRLPVVAARLSLGNRFAVCCRPALSA